MADEKTPLKAGVPGILIRRAKNKYLMLKVLKELSGKSAGFPEFEEEDFNPFRRSTQVSIDNYKDNEDGEMAEDQKCTLLDSSPTGERPPQKNKFLPPLIIFHYSPFKMGWDWVTLILVLYTAVFTPFMAAFTIKLSSNKGSVQPILVLSNVSTPRLGHYLPDLPDTTNITVGAIHGKTPTPISSPTSSPDAGWMDFLNAVEIFVDIMFVADIIINFRTTYIDDGEVVVNPKKIAVNYMKGWFVIDAVAAIPFDYILYGAGSGDTLTQGITGILKTARLLRLLRVARKIDQYSEYGAAVLVLLMATFTLMAHWLACLFYAITTFERSRVLQAPISWLDELAKQHGIVFSMNGTEPDTKSRYITALYFTFTILTSVGFGNVAPVTNYEKVFTIFAMLLGCLISAAIFGNVSSIMLRLYRGTEEYHEMLASIKEFIKFHYFPKPLANRLIESYQNARAFANGVDMNCVLKSFPECLQADICLHLNKTLLSSCILFKNASPGCMRALSMKFKSLHAPTGDTLIHPGDVLDSLYFVTRGSIEILKEDTIMAILGKDDIFGTDVKQIQPSDKKLVSKSAFSIRAMSYAEMHKISMEDLQAIFVSYPDFAYDFTLKFEVTFNVTLDISLCSSDKDEEMMKFIEIRRRKSQHDSKKPQVIANGFHKFVRPDMDAEAVPTIVDASSQYSTLSKIESLKLEKQKDISLGLDRNGTDRTVGRIGTSKSPSSSIRTSNIPHLPRVSELLPVLGDVFSDEMKFHGGLVRHVSPSTASYAPKSSFSTAGLPSSCSLPPESEGLSGCTKPDLEEQLGNGIPAKFLKDVDARLKKINRRMGKFENELSTTIDAILNALGYSPLSSQKQEQASLSSPYFAYKSNQRHVPGVYGSTHLLGVSPVIHEPPLMSP